MSIVEIDENAERIIKFRKFLWKYSMHNIIVVSYPSTHPPVYILQMSHQVVYHIENRVNLWIVTFESKEKCKEKEWKRGREREREKRKI